MSAPRSSEHIDARLAALFPDPDAPRPGRSAKRKWRAALVAVLALAVTIALATDAFGSGAGGDYRTAVVANHPVASLLTGVATIEPVAQATVAFPVAGTVAAVNVKVGDHVAPGQTLASLDTQSLMDTLHQKQVSLTQAQLTLEKALSGQSVGGAGAASTNASLRSQRSGSATSIRLVAAYMSSDQSELGKLQQAVLDAQKAVDAAIAAATTAYNNALSVCAAVTSNPNPPPTSTQVSACESAISAALDAENQVRIAQNTLVDASKALDDFLQKLAKDETTTTTTPPPTPPPTTAEAKAPSTPSPAAGSTHGGGTSTGSFGGGASGGRSTAGGSASASPSAADLASYQQAVDAAQAQVAVAGQAVNQATIGSPIVGTVVAVNLAVGDAVSAGSSTSDITVKGDGGYEVSTLVSVDQLHEVAIGQRATVVPDGSRGQLRGTVSAISVVPQGSTNTTTNYAVVISLGKNEAKLQNGSTGTVAITTAGTKSALAVPTSAVVTTGTRHTVEVVTGGKLETVAVQVGAIGETWTEIKNGLHRGQEVVVANMSQPLPGSATSSANGTGNGANNGLGRFGGGLGGGFPGGFRVRGD